jgi:hypothetical protein
MIANFPEETAAMDNKDSDPAKKAAPAQSIWKREI